MKFFLWIFLISSLCVTSSLAKTKRIIAEAYGQSNKLLKIASSELVEAINDSDFPMWKDFPERKKILLNILPYENLVKFSNKDDIYKNGVLLSMDHQKNPNSLIIYKPFFVMYAGTTDFELEKKAIEVKRELLMEAALIWGLDENEAEIFADNFLQIKEGPSNGATIPSESTIPPNFITTSNFFQDGKRPVIGTFRIDINYQSNLPLRGNDVDSYIRKVDQTQNMCMVAFFRDSSENKILLLSANPQFTNNYNTNIQEWYYLLKPWNAESNITGCKNTEMINALSSKYPGATIGYSLVTLCPNCSTNLLFSGPLELYFPNGTLNKFVPINYLYFMISYREEVVPPLGASCYKTSHCKNFGFDCCNSDHCVKDKTLKAEVDIYSQEYLQSMRDILRDPSSIFNYPNLYNICAEQSWIPPVTRPEESDSEFQEAQLRFSVKKAQYLCQEEGKKQNPNLELFCNNKYLCVKLWKTTEPSFDGNCADLDRKYGSDRYKENKIAIWKTCGCQANPFPKSADDKRCPDFNLKAKRNGNGDIMEIVCSVATSDTPPQTLLNLSPTDKNQIACSEKITEKF